MVCWSKGSFHDWGHGGTLCSKSEGWKSHKKLLWGGLDGKSHARLLNPIRMVKTCDRTCSNLGLGGSNHFWGGNIAMNPAVPCSPSDVGLSKAGAAMTVWPGLKVWSWQGHANELPSVKAPRHILEENVVYPSIRPSRYLRARLDLVLLVRHYRGCLKNLKIGCDSVGIRMTGQGTMEMMG